MLVNLPSDLNFTAGLGFELKFDPSEDFFDAEGGSISVDAELMGTSEWLQWDPAGPKFFVAPGTTGSGHVGTHKFMITLSDDDVDNPLTSYYLFEVEIIQPFIPEFQKKVKGEFNANMPVPVIIDVTKMGVVTVEWDQVMEQPLNLTLFENMTKTEIQVD